MSETRANRIGVSPKVALAVPVGESPVSVYRGRCVSERGAAFTPLRLGTLSVGLRFFPNAWKGITVKRPEGRAPGALGWGAKQIPRLTGEGTARPVSCSF